ncbi:hypothetical protein FB567DRAFT_621821 [Paraphoma chrysanthemicola]|uniref:RBR-type E3 ubiquitin transferase n=1 Tax=Paraphoma chrysanthemicola TaxID=798071 RepID=A0A8K0VZA3_9PLEO|nr:hypothetical protein FB567DRAFT_621821 [Paraphoma chrysanthemicola]
MAPATRLQREPARRVQYDRPTDRGGSRGDPIILEDSPAPETIAEQTLASPPSRLRLTPIARVKGGAVTKAAGARARASDNSAVITKAKKKVTATKRECSICATSKSVSRSFRTTKDIGTCTHFQSICTLCIQKLLKDKMVSRKLDEAELTCPFPDCEYSIDIATLNKVCTNKALFGEYDKALVKHYLAISPHFIACLSTTCGLYFSIEACQANTKRSTKQKISCCYCEYEMCLTCVRPWHGRSGCSMAKQMENEESLAQVKLLGAKPCPNCGVNIEKHGGCDHMTCHLCRHDFCWQCLVPYRGNVQHLDHCPHGRRDVAMDPANWVPDHLNEAQVNRLIHDAHHGLDNNHLQPPNPPQLQLPPPPNHFMLGAMVVGAMQNLFGGGNGGG